jgi:hypothetical protein
LHAPFSLLGEIIIDRPGGRRSSAARHPVRVLAAKEVAVAVAVAAARGGAALAAIRLPLVDESPEP